MKNFLCKHRYVIVTIMIFIFVSSFYSNIVEASVGKFNGYSIVIDAGHGGRDGGSVGVNGTIEKEINLDYALMLKDKLVKNGFRVYLTRKNDDGLYSPLAKNKKSSDMNERLKIIKKSNPNLVISIHMNSFSNSTVSGASTYFRKGDRASELCANLIQKAFQTYCNSRFSSAKVGDYYMLNCSYYTSVLIECGFISNPEEEKLLNTEEYKNKIINAIYSGVLLYFGNYKI